MTLRQSSISQAVNALSSALEEYSDSHIAILKITYHQNSYSMQIFCLKADGTPISTGYKILDRFEDTLHAFRPTDRDSSLSVEISLDKAGHWEASDVKSQLDQVVLRPLVFDTQRAQLPPVTPDELAELHRLWSENSGSYLTRPPLKDDEAQELEKYLGHSIPPQLFEFLKMSNGAEVDYTFEGDTLTDGWSVLSSSEIIQRHKEWSDLAACGPNTGVAYEKGAPGVTQLRLLHPGWIPFAHEYGGNVLGIDLVPGPNGIAGQILEYGRDLYEGPIRHADSLIDFLAGRRYPRRNGSVDYLVHPQEQASFIRADVPDETESLRLFNLESFSISAVLDLPLKSLLLRNIENVDLEGIQYLPLQQLRLIDIESVDLAPLVGHPTLRGLMEENVEKLLHVEALGALPALENVELSHAEALSVLGPVHSLGLSRDLRMEEAVKLINRMKRDSPLEISFVSGAL